MWQNCETQREGTRRASSKKPQWPSHKHTCRVLVNQQTKGNKLIRRKGRQAEHLHQQSRWDEMNMKWVESMKGDRALWSLENNLCIWKSAEGQWKTQQRKTRAGRWRFLWPRCQKRKGSNFLFLLMWKRWCHLHMFYSLCLKGTSSWRTLDSVRNQFMMARSRTRSVAP